MSDKQDQLTRVERIRLEAFAQACNSYGMALGQKQISDILSRAIVIENFIKSAPEEIKQ